MILKINRLITKPLEAVQFNFLYVHQHFLYSEPLIRHLQTLVVLGKERCIHPFRTPSACGFVPRSGGGAGCRGGWRGLGLALRCGQFFLVANEPVHQMPAICSPGHRALGAGRRFHGSNQAQRRPYSCRASRASSKADGNRLRKVCTTTVATRVSVPDFRWRYHTCFSERLKVDFAPFVGPLAVCRRTHARNPCSSVRRTIQRLDRANKVCSCAVFLASPR